MQLKPLSDGDRAKLRRVCSGDADLDLLTRKRALGVLRRQMLATAKWPEVERAPAQRAIQAAIRDMYDEPEVGAIETR